jgi:hypothetical protein
MARLPLTIRSINSPDPAVVAEAAVALILDYHAKTSSPLLPIIEGPQRDLDPGTAPRSSGACEKPEPYRHG